MAKLALIFGITGQDGSYLADLLIGKGYEVHGVVRRSSSEPANLWRIKHLLTVRPGDHPPAERLTIHPGDLLDPASVYRIIGDILPHEIYNFADQDHVGYSKATPGYSVEVTHLGVCNVLEAVRQLCTAARVFQPVSATMFGDVLAPQDEQTPLDPRSPYAVAKAAAYHLCRYYRLERQLFVSTAIYYNHDSERRGPDYLLQKIARAAVAFRLGKRTQPLSVWNWDDRVDVGYAPEYVDAAWKITQLDRPGDFVVGTGRGYSIRNLIAETIEAMITSGPGECPYRPGALFKEQSGDPAPTRIADCRKAHSVFGWDPKHDAASVVRLLVRYFLEHQERLDG